MNQVALGGKRQMARPGFGGIALGAVCALAAGLFSLQNDDARNKFRSSRCAMVRGTIGRGGSGRAEGSRPKDWPSRPGWAEV